MAEPPGGDVHPSDDLLLALHDNVLFSGDRPPVESHVKTCARCRARLVALTEEITPTSRAAPEAVREPAPTRTPRQPRPWGTVLARLAAVVVVFGVVGGLGIFARRELDRRSAEPISLAPAPAVPESTPPPAISGIPEPPGPEPPADPAAANEAAPSTVPALPIEIISPNRNFRWRINGLEVERTNNGGTDWQAQTVMLPAPIAAGHAPSAAVCWLVGQGGTVLVALGPDWKNVSLKEKVDLVRIAAIDSMNATVTTRDGREFTTSDAGATWNAVP